MTRLRRSWWQRNGWNMMNAVIGISIGVLILLAFLALALWMRAAAPCWVFPLKEAPTRCLPGGH